MNYSMMMRLEPFDTMETITERALTKASETGVPQRFEFDRKLFEAQPKKPGYGTVVMIGEVRRELSQTAAARAEIAMCSFAIMQRWDAADIRRECGTRPSGGYLLVAGESASWLLDLRNRLCELLSDRDSGLVSSVNQRRVVVTNGPTVLFETYSRPDGFRGMKFEVAFLQEDELGGNYNKFAYRSMSRDRARWEEKQERSVRADARWANFKEIEQDRMAALAKKAAEERNQQPQYAQLKPRNLGATAQAVAQMQMQALANIQNVQKAYEQAKPGVVNLSEVAMFTLNETQKSIMNEMAKNIANPIMYAESTANGVNGGMVPGSLTRSGPVADDYGTIFPSYSGLSRSQDPEQEVLRLRGLLQQVERVLGRHLREQLSAAPSSGSVYASGPGYAVTAFEIQQVVQALDLVSGISSPFWSAGIDLGEGDFTAESEDGEKIVLSKDGDRFDSGVLFDPANRPIRKFKLKEMAA